MATKGRTHYNQFNCKSQFELNCSQITHVFPSPNQLDTIFQSFEETVAQFSCHQTFILSNGLICSGAQICLLTSILSQNDENTHNLILFRKYKWNFFFYHGKGKKTVQNYQKNVLFCLCAQKAHGVVFVSHKAILKEKMSNLFSVYEFGHALQWAPCKHWFVMYHATIFIAKLIYSLSVWVHKCLLAVFSLKFFFL